MATATMINKKTYVSATFLDEERKNIEVLLDMPHTETKTLTPHVIEADPKSAEYKALLKLVTEDQLHEQTWESKRAESDAFLATARSIIADEFNEAEAVANNAVDIDSLLTKTQIYPTIVNTIFTNMENEDHLFALKLALFDIQEIRESTDTSNKTGLRKGKNKIEVLQKAFQIVGVRDHRSDVPADSDPKENEAELEKVEAEPIEHGDLGAGAEVDTPAKVIKARKAGQSIVAGQKPAKRKLTEAQRKKAGLNKV